MRVVENQSAGQTGIAVILTCYLVDAYSTLMAGTVSSEQPTVVLCSLLEGAMMILLSTSQLVGHPHPGLSLKSLF